jgi:hypothetical protein
MINTHLERLVQLALKAFAESHPLNTEEYKRNMFELEFRKNLMQCYCNDMPQNTSNTCTIKPGTVTGTWTTREGPPSNSKLLNG